MITISALENGILSFILLGLFMRFFYVVVLLFFVPFFSFGVFFDEGDYFSLGFGLLTTKGNVFLDRDIVIFEISDGIAFFKGFSGNVDFIFTFPDEWYSFLDFKTFGRYNFFNVKWFLSSKFVFDYGFEFQSHLVKKSNDIYFLYHWYGFFIPYFRASGMFSFEFFKNFYFAIGWYGGMPIVFLPNKEPVWGVPIGYYFLGVGVRNLIFDEISFYYDSSFYILSLSKRF